jgi:RNA polymerase sigma factor (sigma-70 family)
MYPTKSVAAGFFLIILHIFVPSDVIISRDEIYQSFCDIRVVKMGKSDDLYERLISPIEKRMMSIVARIVRDPEDAADVFQEVLALIWAKLERIDRHPNPHAYIIRICITRSYDALRKRARRRRREIRLESIKAKMWPARSLGYIKEGDRVAVIREAIAMLPPNQGQAVLLRIMEDSPYHMIAGVLGCSEATARSHFSKGKARLVKLLNEIGISSYKEEKYNEC